MTLLPLTAAVPWAAIGAVETVTVGEATLLSFANTLTVTAVLDKVVAASGIDRGARAGMATHDWVL